MMKFASIPRVLGLHPLRLIALFGLLLSMGCAGGWGGTTNSGVLIMTQPVSQTVIAGQVATFTVSASGPGALAYQWSEAGVLIPGATGASYITPATASKDNNSTFTVTVTSSTSSVTSTVATLTVETPPVIVRPPSDQTVAVGQSTAFQVTAAGTGPINYQWFRNGAPVSGATGSAYTISVTVAADSGSVFTATASNLAGTVTSTPATLTIDTPPTIMVPPSSTAVNVGKVATFGATATGSAPLVYQWFKAGTAIAGATSNSYTTPATGSGDNGSIFTVTVSNALGSATSAGAVLTVNLPPVINTPPVSQTVVVGKTASFAVVASGTAPFTYQWFNNGVAISGATGSSYTTPATVGGDNGAIYTVTVSNAAGSSASGPATLTVNTPPTITSQPTSQAIVVGQRASFTVVATGTAPLSYQWFRGGVAINGANSTAYTTPIVTASDSGSQYSVQVTNPAGTVTSAAASLTVNNSTPVASGLACSASTPPYNAAISLVPTFSGGIATLGSTGVGSSDVSSSAASGSSYPTKPLLAGQTFTLTVTGTGGAVATASCTSTPTAVTLSNISPANATTGTSPQSFSVSATGGVTDQVVWTASAGTFNGNMWSPPNVAGTYTITATSVDKQSVSVSTVVTVSLPTITSQPASISLCTHSSTTLSIAANYATGYQWNLNGTPIAGATSSTYFIPSAITMDSGSYTVTVSNGAGSVTSNVASVGVGSSITTNPVSLTVLASQVASFSVSASGVAPFKYQWYTISPGASAGTAIAGATASSYTTSPVNATFNGSQYYATVSDGCGVGQITSTTATLTEKSGNAPPTILTHPIGVNVAVGATATLAVVASGTPALAYQWYLIPAGSTAGTVIAIPGATSASYVVPSTATAATDDQDAYFVIVTNAYGTAVSRHATVAVGNGILIQISNEPATLYVDPGNSATFSVAATSSVPLTYQWYEAAPGSSAFVAIRGATSATYTVSSAAVSDTGSVFYVVVSNGYTSSVQSTSASLFVGTLSGIGDLCGGWSALGNATPLSGCSFQLTAATTTQHGEIVWPSLVSTGDIHVSFTVAISDPSFYPADGFALVLGDPTLGATLTSLGATGQGLGAEGIPGFVLGFDTYHNPGDPPVPYIGVGRGETALWENPWFYYNTNISPLAAAGVTVTHDYTISIVQGQMVVTMDGVQVMSGSVTVPPVAYMYVTASTGASYEQTVISNLSATIVAVSN